MAYDDGRALFAGRTTSAIEYQNRVLILVGIRDSQVFDALMLFCNMIVKTLVDKKTKAEKWLKDKHTVTPQAKEMFNRQVWSATVCRVRKSTDSVFFVDDYDGATIEEEDTDSTCRNTPLLAQGESKMPDHLHR
ncbi:hypothetical protein F441_16544 [Phytophthora nicotianae CJ01A1]|uniref:Uncharacterized protein n=1 Tax=Phytophthora nicotianae CJ01A1 TaxID=1317063 RepID=W2W9A8_PHYNI|nr:hypothetical protein F441_16544 [Phytophthora nicotianae CJ01A1]